MFEPQIFTGGMTATNGYLVRNTGKSILIDAPEGVVDWLQRQGVKPCALLLTHQHFDHIHDAGAIQKWAGCPTYAFSLPSDKLTLRPLLRSWGMELDIAPFVVDRILEGEKNLRVDADLDCRLFHIPGHSPDSIAFYFPALNSVFSGDTLMAGAVGRTDFPGGSFDVLAAGIKTHLLSLPGETMLYSGHGDPSSIGEELACNPYMR